MEQQVLGLQDGALASRELYCDKAATPVVQTESGKTL